MRALIAYVALLSSVILGCQKPVDYHSVDGRFHIRFPAAPRERVQRLDSPVGALTLHVVEAGITKNFLVAYADYPNSLEVNDRLDGVRDGMARASGARVLTETAKNLGACSGRELVLESSAGRMRGRIFLCGLRLYEVFWHGRTSFTFNKVVDDFLDSFHVDPEP